MEENTIASLIDPELRQWDHGLIDGIIAPQEVEIIKKILLSHKESEDFLYWPFTHDGHYTCKSGYHFLNAEAALAPIEIEPNQDKELRREVWLLHVSKKVKNMLCRACRISCPQKRIWFVGLLSIIQCVTVINQRQKTSCMLFGLIRRLILFGLMLLTGVFA